MFCRSLFSQTQVAIVELFSHRDFCSGPQNQYVQLAHVFQLVIDFNSICLYSACLRIILDTAIFILPFTRPFQKLANDFPISSSFFSDLRLFSELCGQIFIYQYKVLRNLSCFWVQLLGYSEHKHYDLDPGYMINSIL